MHHADITLPWSNSLQITLNSELFLILPSLFLLFQSPITLWFQITVKPTSWILCRGTFGNWWRREWIQAPLPHDDSPQHPRRAWQGSGKEHLIRCPVVAHRSSSSWISNPLRRSTVPITSRGASCRTRTRSLSSWRTECWMTCRSSMSPHLKSRSQAASRMSTLKCF